MGTKSKLATKSILCTWEFNKRTEKVIGIIPHYMAAHWTAEQCATYFKNNGLENSANYCIGYDGSCVCNVYEENRAWTSSSAWADQRCITIEIGGNADNVAIIPEPALEKFKQLATDIALRYGISKYTYTGNTKGNFMLHKFFAATPCPGWYFESKIPELIKDINARIKAKDIYGKGEQSMFKDVKTTDKHYVKYKKLAELGIMTGSDGKFKPKGKVTRGTLAVVIYRTLKYLGKIK